MKRRSKWFLGILSMLLSVFLLAGCAGTEKEKEISLTGLIDLTPSNIEQIKVSEGGGLQTSIENSEQIEEICAFLSSAFTLKNHYRELKFSDINWSGMGDYFLIIYSNNTTAHIQIYQNSNEIEISGQTKEGEIKDQWRIYPLVNFSQQERLKEILSMTPAE